MRSLTIYALILGMSAASFVLFSCTDMNDVHNDVAREYAEEGESIYVGKTDSLKLFPGKERIKLRYWSSDSRASKLLVFWSARSDSVVFDIPSDPPGDSVDVVVPDLPENSYTFEIVTANEDLENRSVPVEAAARTYGDRFQATLTDRVVQTIGLDMATDSLNIKWLGEVGSAIGTEVSYKDDEGETVSEFVPIGEEENKIGSFDSELRYRTLFLPEPTAFDTFYTEYSDLTLEDYLPFEEQINPDHFSRWNPSGIPYTELGGFPIENLWNGITFNDAYIFNSPAEYTEFPFIFTFDLGQEVKLDSLRYHQRIREAHDLMYTHAQNIESFEIWGAADSTGLNEEYTSGWEEIGEFTIEKPSGLPYGEVSDEDIQAAIDGHNFDIDPNAPEVRYIRFEVTGKWVGEPDPVTALGELQLWGSHAYFTNQ